MTAIVINAIQLTALVAFAILAIAFRMTHPDLAYAHSSLGSVVLPHNMTNVLFQGTIAILLLVGFESVTALGGEAINPKRDVRRAVLLSLAIQGAVAYIIEYVAANFFVNTRPTATTAAGAAVAGYGAAASGGADRRHGPVHRRHDAGRHGLPSRDHPGRDRPRRSDRDHAGLPQHRRSHHLRHGPRQGSPGILGMLHFRHATPHYGVIALAIVSAVLGGYAVLSADNLLQITLASNTGTFLVYGMTNAIVLVAFGGLHKRNIIKHVIVPVLGLLVNIGMLVGS